MLQPGAWKTSFQLASARCRERRRKDLPSWLFPTSEDLFQRSFVPRCHFLCGKTENLCISELRPRASRRQDLFRRLNHAGQHFAIFARVTATPWKNWPLNHPRRRPPSSVLFCLKLKSWSARERPTNKSGNGSPKPGSISPAKRFADSFAGRARKRAHPRRRARKVSKSRNCTPDKLRPG